MRRIIKTCLVMVLSLFVSVNVLADVQPDKMVPDYTTDYYMIVESKAGGIDIYAQPDLESEKLNEQMIPNGTALHIVGEVEDKENNRTWGYTEYRSMNGYVPLDDCRPAQSRQEAIDSELYIAGRDKVDYNADYDVKAYDESGSQSLYQGPGEKYGTVPGVRTIQNGETLHITEDAQMVDGSHWGATTVDGKEGWMNLDKTEENADRADQKKDNADSKESAAASDTGESETAAELTVTPSITPELTVTPEPTVTEAPTDTPEPTAEPTATVERTITTEPTVTQVPVVTSELTEAAESSASAKKEQDDSIWKTPFLWIGLAAVLAVIAVLIYHKKKSK